MGRLPARAFWFLRHGETDWNADGRSQGRTDVPLNEVGVGQAHAAAAALQGRGIASIVSSPLGRAHHTASIASEALGLPVTVITGLQEVSFGVNEGHAMGQAWFSDWVAGKFTPERGESFDALRTRAAAALAEALAHPAPVLVVAHGALFRALRAEMGLAPDVRLPNAVPMFCQPGAPWNLSPLT